MYHYLSPYCSLSISFSNCYGISELYFILQFIMSSIKKFAKFTINSFIMLSCIIIIYHINLFISFSNFYGSSELHFILLLDMPSVQENSPNLKQIYS